MNVSEFTREILTLGPGQNSHETRLYTRLLVRFLADNIKDLHFDDGSYPHAPSDYQKILRLIADQVRVPLAELAPVNFADHRLRLRGRADLESTCPRCGHIHEGSSACGAQMGGGGICPCEMEVSA